MCKGCSMGDTIDYLDNYSYPFEKAAGGVKEAHKWLNNHAHDMPDSEQKRHLKHITKRLKLVAKELESIRKDL